VIRRIVLGIVLALSRLSYPQAIHLSGGSSTIMEASGGGLTAYLPGNDLTIGSGLNGGNFGFGATNKFQWGGMKWVAGDSAFSYAVDGAGSSVYVRGLEVTRGDFSAFAGLTGSAYQIPFFSTMQQAKHPGVGLYYRHKRGRLTFSSLDIASSTKTFIQSLRFDGAKLMGYGNAGLVSNRFTAGGLLLFKPSKNFNLSATHVTQPGYTNDNLSISLFSAHVSVMRNSYLGETILGEMAGVSYRYRWLSVSSNWFRSSGRSQFAQVFSQSFHHWQLTEALDNANQFSGGLSYHNNVVTLSVNQSLMFVPGTGFTQVVSAGLGFHLRDTGVNSQIYRAPNLFKYTTSADSWLYGPIPDASGHSAKPSIGKYLYSGTVELDGIPQEGVAVKVGGKELVYSNRDGRFEVRSKKNQRLPLELVLDENIVAGEFQLISCPASVTPDAPVTIFLKEKKQ
jgi:hypothetical protein